MRYPEQIRLKRCDCLGSQVAFMWRHSVRLEIGRKEKNVQLTAWHLSQGQQNLFFPTDFPNRYLSAKFLLALTKNLRFVDWPSPLYLISIKNHFGIQSDSFKLVSRLFISLGWAKHDEKYRSTTITRDVISSCFPTFWYMTSHEPALEYQACFGQFPREVIYIFVPRFLKNLLNNPWWIFHNIDL